MRFDLDPVLAKSEELQPFDAAGSIGTASPFIGLNRHVATSGHVRQEQGSVGAIRSPGNNRLGRRRRPKRNCARVDRCQLVVPRNAHGYEFEGCV